MPELPEVENVCRDLSSGFGKEARIAELDFRRADLRDQIPKKKLKTLEGARILSVQRRAKYILIHTENGILLSHLGMTGQWRFDVKKPQLAKHDHFVLKLTDGRTVIYRDPRRFGILDFLKSDEVATHKRLKELGPEPLSPDFSVDWLAESCKGSSASIKSLLMNQQVVVGVGNIYASEALYSAKISPKRRGLRVKRDEFPALIAAIRQTLVAAIAGGGSTIRDYRRVGSESGEFQDSHQVYDRDGEPCLFCQTPIRRVVLVGRSTFFCPQCQV